MKHHIKETLARYRENTSGQFAVVFALTALPLLAITTLALDMSNAERMRVKLSASLDDAALAAVLDQTLTPQERSVFAEDYFWQFHDSSDPIKLSVLSVDDDSIKLQAKMQVETTLGGAVGIKEINVAETAASELTKGRVVCMLALDPDGEHSFEVSHGASFDAETCAVQVNSTHKEAAVVHNGATATAQGFCISGGAAGDYTPFANTDCGIVADPYQYRRVPAPSNCISAEIIDSKLNDWRAEVFLDFSYLDYTNGPGGEIIDVIGGVTLEPGTYCGGLYLGAKNVTFAPGEYIIKDGPLVFDSGTVAYGEDVTFIFAGNEASLQVELGSSVDLSAPERGDLAGLVFAQYLETEHGAAAALPSAESIISSGGTLKLVGTAYLPTQKISFVGGSISSAQAPATSFIGYQLRIDDGAKISVAVDHNVAGLPPILPRSDESARLTQ